MAAPTLRVWAVVPVKALGASKQRLAEVLGRRREPFVRALLSQTLSALTGARRLAGTLVVTADPQIAEEATLAGAEVCLADVDLNGACVRGLAEVRARGADACMLVHADLALLTSRGVDALVSAYLDRRQQQGSSLIGLVRCKEGTGTNVVLVDPCQPFVPAFGPASFAAHQLAAGTRGYELRSDEAAFDVDTVSDLRRLARAMVPARLRPFVSGSTEIEPMSLLDVPLPVLVNRAARLRDEGHEAIVTYSRKVFLPLTHLCRDVCHYCTFARTPRRLAQAYMSVDEAIRTAAAGAQRGCKEALFTLGEKPELRYTAAREWLNEAGFDSTLHYVAHVAAAVRDQTGLLPHINAGCMTAAEMASLRPVSASMGLMLESTSERLCAKGGPHHGSPDKRPAIRLATIEEAGRQCVPFTTGLLIGIGETRAERIDALLAIQALHERYGHIQEIIIQNFLPKAGTRMAKAEPASTEELIWTIAVARNLFGPQMNIQAPPNLNAGALDVLVQAGINDWGGVSPVTPDYVNPEAPWPEIERLREETAAAGKTLAERLTIYREYVSAPEIWLDPAMRRPVLELSDGSGRGREDAWRAGRSEDAPPMRVSRRGQSSSLLRMLDELGDRGAERLGIDEVATLFDVRGADYTAVCNAADALRARVVGDTVTFVVNRNINYTNMCTYHCGFCAFSKGTRKHEGAERGYLYDTEEIGRRVSEAAQKGATEVCLQGGIHPSFNGNTYLDILRAVKRAVPAMHVHAFSPLEVWHGAHTNGQTLHAFLQQLRDEGLGSLPGTAAEILDDPVRQVLCPDKISASQWLEVIETAHRVGLRTTSTIMYGHVEDYRAWARHLLALRELQRRTGGITEFVPLPFVAHEAPLYKRGQARPGPTYREAVLMHAVSRLVLHPHIPHVQTSWVKMGRSGIRTALQAGANDLGGTLMNESITRAAGATHGQMLAVEEMRDIAGALDRRLMQRTTLYASRDESQAGRVVSVDTCRSVGSLPAAS
ncbi:MAG TPA: 5-amino-6-(D-ribitylamino)uracil--L-tyrosine 4-hydroxyphenyl transferase CofH [Steroidobacteraceae bacterium]|jgi:FO synthase|nr:5-amino-6-(D-ribitylamino)uracil--L-tyrosine 4-hydroxyphenyl transferase CofH [Steroidobacteraceae bacterium]